MLHHWVPWLVHHILLQVRWFSLGQLLHWQYWFSKEFNKEITIPLCSWEHIASHTSFQSSWSLHWVHHQNRVFCPENYHKKHTERTLRTLNLSITDGGSSEMILDSFNSSTFSSESFKTHSDLLHTLSFIYIYSIEC